MYKHRLLSRGIANGEPFTDDNTGSPAFIGFFGYASSRRGLGRWRQYISEFGNMLSQFTSIGANFLQWETLRRVFLCLDRKDLAEKAASGVDVNIFRTDFDF